jgi:hypothetical protein
MGYTRISVSITEENLSRLDKNIELLNEGVKQAREIGLPLRKYTRSNIITDMILDGSLNQKIISLAEVVQSEKENKISTLQAEINRLQAK